MYMKSGLVCFDLRLTLCLELKFVLMTVIIKDHRFKLVLIH